MLLSLLLALFTSFEPVDRSEAGQWFSQARQHFEKRQWEQSRAAARKALESDPQFADAEVLLGLIAGLQAQPLEAERHLKRAIDLEPSNHQAHSFSAFTLSRSGSVKLRRAMSKFSN